MPFTCPQRSATREAERAEEERAQETRRRERDLAVKLETLPSALRGVRLADLDTEGRGTALDAAERWSSGELSGLVLLGPIGVGKTTIAAAADVAYMANCAGPAPRWVNTVQALNDLSRSFNDRRRIDAMNALDGKHAPLILDDVDKAKPNATAAAVPFGAIDTCVTHKRSPRYRARRPPDRGSRPRRSRVA